jgi:hypothetical protein
VLLARQQPLLAQQRCLLLLLLLLLQGTEHALQGYPQRSAAQVWPLVWL